MNEELSVTSLAEPVACRGVANGATAQGIQK